MNSVSHYKIRLLKKSLLIGCAIILFVCLDLFGVDNRHTIGIFKRTQIGADNSTAQALAWEFSQAGFEIVNVSENDVSGISPDKFAFYIIPDARSYPAIGFPGINNYVREKGTIIVTGGDVFSDVLYKQEESNGVSWIDLAKLNEIPPTHIVFDFEEDISWSTNADPGTKGLKVETTNGVKGRCLSFEVPELGQWVISHSPVMNSLFAESDNMLSLWAKGDENTSKLLLEIDEKDGSRWVYYLSITAEWKKYVIPFRDFKYLKNSPTKNERGEEGDSFNQANAVKFAFGEEAGGSIQKNGAYRFWIDEIGGISSSVKMDYAVPVIETVSPSYKTYPMRNIKALSLNKKQKIIKTNNLFAPVSNMWAAIHRPEGLGFTCINNWRYIPILDAFDADGEYRGSPLSLLLTTNGAELPSFACFCGVAHPDSAIRSVLISVCKRIADGCFLVEGGSENFAYYPNETAILGARIMNGSDADSDMLVRITVSALGKDIASKEKRITVKRGIISKVSFDTKLALPSDSVAIVKTELLRDSIVVDAISHEVVMLAPKDKEPNPNDYVTVRNGNFYCQGRKWYPNGINYWPLWQSGLEPDIYSQGWFYPGFYSPEEIERDLTIMNKLGINMVSVSITGRVSTDQPVELRSLQNFLYHCNRHDIKVNAFIRNAAPDNFDETYISNVINQANLKRATALFAYDIIWEASLHMFKPGNTTWTEQWNKWICDRYGSANNALSDWNYLPSCANNVIPQPKSDELQNNGAGRIYASAYRRFMDDQSSRIWNDARRRIKKYDPVHLISFRQGNTTYYDFALTGPVKHVDFISPEGYAYSNTEDGYNALCFTTRYLDLTSGGKPTYWAEFGVNVWDRGQMAPSCRALQIQEEYIEKYYRMALEAGANGCSPWWFPGGYRVDEQSDFGIINPDGTPRPSAEVVRKYASRFINARACPEPNEWYTFDRESNSGGYWFTIFNEGKDSYKNAKIKGNFLGIRTPGTGNTSADTPLLAVGNTAYNGNNPPKYLDAEFNYISVKTKNGWQNLYSGNDEIIVPEGQPVIVKASIGNIQEAKWLASPIKKTSGYVYLSAREGDILFCEPILADTPYLSDAETAEFTLVKNASGKKKVVFEMTSLDRMWFGEKWAISFIAE